MPRLVPIALAATTLLGCGGGASLGEGLARAPGAPSEGALVYTYRPTSSVGALTSYSLAADGEPVAVLSNGSYAPYYTAASRATFTVDSIASARQLFLPPLIGIAYYVRFATDEPEPLADLELEPGRTYYLRFSVDGGWQGVVDPGTARKEMEGLSVARRLDQGRAGGAP